MSTVAVRKWMNVYKPMVKANSYFVGGVRAVLDPIPNVTAQRHESVSNFMDWNPPVFLGASVLTRPLPCLVEHFCVQLPHVSVKTGEPSGLETDCAAGRRAERWGPTPRQLTAGGLVQLDGMRGKERRRSELRGSPGP
jgi:hypothetical protein